MNKAGHGKPVDQALWDDWWTIWQSELAQLATDRELRELWEPAWRLWQTLMPGEGAGDDGAGGATRADGTPGAAALMAASDVGDDAVVRLQRRVAELERRLAERDQSARGDTASD